MKDANYWRRRMGLPEEHEGNVGAGSSAPAEPAPSAIAIIENNPKTG